MTNYEQPIESRLLQEIGMIAPGEAAQLELPKEFAPIMEEYECLSRIGKWWRKHTCKHPGPVLEMRFRNDEGTEFHTNFCLRCREQWGGDQMRFEAGIGPSRHDGSRDGENGNDGRREGIL